MNRTRGMLSVAVLATALGLGPATVEAAATTEKTWCMTYCDVIHIGCLKTLGWFDDQACDEWKEGCLDGCRAPD